MAQFKKMLSRNGKLILTVPIGMDLLIWNLMRIYGPVRFPLLLSGHAWQSFSPDTGFPWGGIGVE